MLVFLKKRLVMLSTPKCGSTALEATFGPHADVVISNVPQAKHTPFRKYNRYLRAYFETFTDGPLEVVCLVREPIDWLGSWWRYRGRADLSGNRNSTEGISFEEFVDLYLSGRAGPAKVGNQAQFVSDKDGNVGVDRIWRYENMESFVDWMADRVGVDADLEQLNVSPTGPITLSDQMRTRAEAEMQRNFQIYRDVAV